MEKEFIPYEQALVLKELGFDEECFSYYNYKEEITFSSCFNKLPIIMSGKKCAIPTFSQAFRWFMEKGYFAQIYPDNSQFVNEAKEWFYSIKNGSITTNDEKYYSYEQAELGCINKLIEIVKEHGTNVD